MPATAYTLTELRALLAARWEGTPFWTTVEADAALADACRTWNALTGYWRQRVVVSVPPGDPLVPVPGTLTHVATLSYAGRSVVGPVSLAKLGQLAPNWRRDSSLTDPPQVWARLGLGALVVWPAPGPLGQLGPVQYELDGIRRTPILVNPSDTLDAEEAIVDLLLGEALHAASFTGGQALLDRTIGGHQRLLQAATGRVTALRRTTWARALLEPEAAERQEATPAPSEAEA